MRCVSVGCGVGEGSAGGKDVRTEGRVEGQSDGCCGMVGCFEGGRGCIYELIKQFF